ncbi:heavy-metal-associated domain-containing protein [Microbacterium sp. NPDC091313]
MTEQRLNLGLTAPAAGCGGDACACGSGTPASAASDRDVVARLDVIGMTCEHCVRAVTDEVSAVAGVDGVDIALAPGGASTVTVRGRGPVDMAALRAAVDEAGYSLA